MIPKAKELSIGEAILSFLLSIALHQNQLPVHSMVLSSVDRLLSAENMSTPSVEEQWMKSSR